MIIPNPETTRLQEILGHRETRRKVCEMIETVNDDATVAVALQIPRKEVRRILWRAGYKLQWVCLSRFVEGRVVRAKGRKYDVLRILNETGKKAAAEFLDLSHKAFNGWLKQRTRDIGRVWMKVELPQPEPLDYTRGAAQIRRFEEQPELAEQVRNYLAQYSDKWPEVRANTH